VKRVSGGGPASERGLAKAASGRPWTLGCQACQQRSPDGPERHVSCSRERETGTSVGKRATPLAGRCSSCRGIGPGWLARPSRIPSKEECRMRSTGCIYPGIPPICLPGCIYPGIPPICLPTTRL